MQRDSHAGSFLMITGADPQHQGKSQSGPRYHRPDNHFTAGKVRFLRTMHSAATTPRMNFMSNRPPRTQGLAAHVSNPVASKLAREINNGGDVHTLVKEAIVDAQIHKDWASRGDTSEETLRSRFWRYR